ncbi:MAG: nucleotidyl transferase AbiEii/AbiGii toxin family protein [Candidatus Beckwithbacteria bacterium]
MISQDQLNQLVIKNHTSKINIYREYCQNLILSLLYSHPDSTKLLFKGGTALKIAYQSPRFSEDLDFDLNHLSNHQLQNLLLNISIGLNNNNLNHEIAEAKQTTGGYLANFNFSLYKLKFIISLQASIRKKTASQPNIQLINNDYIPSYTALLLSETNLIAEKIQAALTRAKPRDFFDVYFLLRKNLVPVVLRNKLKLLNQKVKTEKLDFKELKDLLPTSMAILTKNFHQSFITETDKFT